MTWMMKPGNTDDFTTIKSSEEVDIATLLQFLKGELTNDKAEQINQLLETDELLYRTLEGISALYDDYGEAVHEILETLEKEQTRALKSKLWQAPDETDSSLKPKSKPIANMKNVKLNGINCIRNLNHKEITCAFYYVSDQIIFLCANNHLILGSEEFKIQFPLEEG